MKRLLLFLFLTLGMTWPARSEVSVSLNFFVDALDPYGSWIEVEDYGYCWRPRVAEEDPDWRPYTLGHWAYTDGGWTWISDEEWGWATYHYGRWVRLHRQWCWVPDDEWAPAWVSWRESEDSLGWAPLPPEARWDVRIGFSSWTDGYYDVGPDCYNFVPRRFIGERSLRSHYIDRRRNFGIFEHSANITRIVHRPNVVNNIFVDGPQLERVERDGGTRLERLHLRRDDSEFQRDRQDNNSRDPGQRYRALSRIDGDQLIVAAPKVDRAAKFSPPRRIVERLGTEEIDRGWRGVDPKDKDRVRRSLRASAEKSLPQELPARPAKPRIASVVPATPPSNQPPEEVRKPVSPEPGAEVPPRRAPGDDSKPRPPRKGTGREVPEPDLRPQPPAKEPDVPPQPPAKKSDLRPQPPVKESDVPPQPPAKKSDLRPQPPAKPALPPPPSSSPVKPGDDTEKSAPPPSRKPRVVPDQPEPPKKRVGREGKPSAVPEQKTPAVIVPHEPPPRAVDDSRSKKERPSRAPAAAPPTPPQIMPAPPPPPKVKEPRKVDQGVSPPRPQPQPPTQGRPGPAPKKTPPSSEAEEEKRKGKKH